MTAGTAPELAIIPLPGAVVGGRWSFNAIVIVLRMEIVTAILCLHLGPWSPDVLFITSGKLTDEGANLCIGESHPQRFGFTFHLSLAPSRSHFGDGHCFTSNRGLSCPRTVGTFRNVLVFKKLQRKLNHEHQVKNRYTLLLTNV